MSESITQNPQGKEGINRQVYFTKKIFFNKKLLKRRKNRGKNIT